MVVYIELPHLKVHNTTKHFAYFRTSETMKRKTKKEVKTSVEHHIGKQLSRFRRQCGLSHEEVDDRLCARRGSTKEFEEGKRFVSPAHLMALSQVLKIDVSHLFPKQDATKPTLAPDADDITSAKRMLRVYYQIEDPALRRKVVDLLKEVAG
tara:strand:- start:238 stop:693 length:456 start_codon:yes stop_codon:yes gene_type:complete